ncbi:hypothetical protein [Pseudonocardia sp. GCM10023141]|uniref:hypothetical protein n=1 Tax=Pseudonocardia sp. GCM10023141 TaxID=3252653 RepID=UPI00361217E6
MPEHAVADEVELVRSMIRDATALGGIDGVQTALAGGRVRAILVELLMEIAPHEIQGPWQDVT